MLLAPKQTLLSRGDKQPSSLPQRQRRRCASMHCCIPPRLTNIQISTLYEKATVGNHGTHSNIWLFISCFFSRVFSRILSRYLHSFVPYCRQVHRTRWCSNMVTAFHGNFTVRSVPYRLLGGSLFRFPDTTHFSTKRAPCTRGGGWRRSRTPRGPLRRPRP